MIECTKLTKRFGSLTALDALTLSIGEGEIFGFIGPNGAGKSTTMKILSCLLTQDAGTATVAGLDTRRNGDAIRAAIGYMPDFLGVYDDLVVDEYLQFFAAAFRIKRTRRKPLVQSVLELTDLTEKRLAPVSSLSRGMQQRLGIARVLIHEPKVLLLDEPASGLDPRARIEMRSLLLELKAMGKTIMVSSHILSELAEMCDSIGIIERGSLIYAGTIADAYKRVRAGDRVTITFEPTTEQTPSEQTPAHQAARAHAMLTGDERLAEVTISGDRLIAELAPDQSSHHFLLEKLITAGLRIAAVVPQEIKLEDAFLSLTEGRVQ